MPFEIDWYIPYRVIDERTYGVITVEDLHNHTDTLARFLTEAQTHAPQHLVYQLYDDTGVERMPPAYLLFEMALPVLRFKNRGAAFHITNSRVWHNMFQLAGHIMSFQVQAFATREDALQILEKTMLKDDARMKRG